MLKKKKYLKPQISFSDVRCVGFLQTTSGGANGPDVPIEGPGGNGDVPPFASIRFGDYDWDEGDDDLDVNQSLF